MNHRRDPILVWDEEPHALWTHDDYATLCGRTIGMLRAERREREQERRSRDQWPGEQPEYAVGAAAVEAIEPTEDGHAT